MKAHLSDAPEVVGAKEGYEQQKDGGRAVLQFSGAA